MFGFVPVVDPCVDSVIAVVGEEADAEYGNGGAGNDDGEGGAAGVVVDDMLLILFAFRDEVADSVILDLDDLRCFCLMFPLGSSSVAVVGMGLALCCPTGKDVSGDVDFPLGSFEVGFLGCGECDDADGDNVGDDAVCDDDSAVDGGRFSPMPVFFDVVLVSLVIVCFLPLPASSASLLGPFSLRDFLVGGPFAVVLLVPALSSSPSLLEVAGDDTPLLRLLFRCLIGTFVAKILYSNFGSIVQKAPFPESLFDRGILMKALFSDKL